MSTKHQVFVAMSGGVDSALTAAILKDRGYRVTGIHMSTWKDPEWVARTRDQPAQGALAEEVADTLGIPFINLDVKAQFYQDVVQNFIRQYLAGNTPNPCLFCNPQVKWGILQSYALDQGADFFATGHYARIERVESGPARLLRGSDKSKDQSYVLSMLSRAQLSNTLLPLGGLTKREVRAQAKDLKLPVADRQDSQDLCFLGDVNYRDFLNRFAPESSKPGEIVDVAGTRLGEHQGLAFYTIGQRKGIRISAPEPYYVVRKDIENNRLVVGFNHQADQCSLDAVGVNWIAGSPPKTDEVYEVMVRYRARPEVAQLISASEEKFRLKFKKALHGITPGQVAVLYQGDECLGGGTIQSAG